MAYVRDEHVTVECNSFVYAFTVPHGIISHLEILLLFIDSKSTVVYAAFLCKRIKSKSIATSRQ